MNSSLKIGALSGLIAGIVASIIGTIIAIITFNTENSYFDLPAPPTTPLSYVATVESIINISWGIALGIIYVKFYNMIPGKRASKGLLYGVILGSMFWIRAVTFDIAYSMTQYYFADSMPVLSSIGYGIVLGLLYELLQRKHPIDQRELEVKRSDMIGVFHPSALGGLLGGIIISFAHMLLWDPLYFPEYVAKFEFLTVQFGAHAFINMAWGMVFGILYVMFYEKIPGQRILKGIAFAMLLFFIAGLRFVIYGLLYWIPWIAISWGSGILMFLTYGLVLGYLYRKPSD